MLSKEEIKIRKRIVEADLKTMTDYMMLQLGKGDMHGVMDATADIRELTAELKAYRSVVEVDDEDHRH